MSIWNSKPLVVALGLLTVAGCGDISAPFEAEKTPPQAEVITQAKLAGGLVIVSAPQGYCIDSDSVRASRNAGFALLARCDTLGVNGFFAGQELALITVTTAPRASGADAPTLDDLVASAAPSQVLETTHVNDLPLIRLATDASVSEGLSAEYWRGALSLNGQLVGFALYAPETSPALSGEGARILGDLAALTRKASPASSTATTTQTTAPTDQTTSTEANKSPFKLISGLFE